MRIVDARWTSRVNMLLIQCECDTEHEHRADRWNVKCPGCGLASNIETLRSLYREGAT